MLCTVSFIVSVNPSCSSSPSPRLVLCLHHPVLFIVSVNPSCSSSPSTRLVHRFRHPVLFFVCVTPSYSSSPSTRFVHSLRHPCLVLCLRHPVLFIVSVNPSCSSSPSPRLVLCLRFICFNEQVISEAIILQTSWYFHVVETTAQTLNISHTEHFLRSTVWKWIHRSDNDFITCWRYCSLQRTFLMVCESKSNKNNYSKN